MKIKHQLQSQPAYFSESGHTTLGLDLAIQLWEIAGPFRLQCRYHTALIYSQYCTYIFTVVHLYIQYCTYIFTVLHLYNSIALIYLQYCTYIFIVLHLYIYSTAIIYLQYWSYQSEVYNFYQFLLAHSLTFPLSESCSLFVCLVTYSTYAFHLKSSLIIIPICFVLSTC